MREAKAAYPDERVAALVGGFHLMGALGPSSLGVKPEETETLGRALLDLGMERTFLCHCTGDPGRILCRRDVRIVLKAAVTPENDFIRKQT